MASRPHGRRILLFAVSVTVLVLGFGTGAAPKRPSKPPPEQDSFTDHLVAYDTARWLKADGWKNGSPFDNAWLADHITFADRQMVIRLDDEADLGEPYSSGNYQTVGFYGYGCYEARFKPVRQSGAVTSFFTYAGPYDNGGNGQHNEIDIEFLGRHFYSNPSPEEWYPCDGQLEAESAATWVQFNFYTNDDNYASRNEHLHCLPFDASADFHDYAFKWTSDGIEWYVDGALVYSVSDSLVDPTPKSTESLQKIMMNLWPVDETAAAWAGAFDYPGQPLAAVYEWVRFTRGQDCAVGEPLEPEPEMPGNGDPSTVLVADIGLSVAARGTQVIARVTVVDGTGGPVAGASVTGAWSGVITVGDTQRETDTEGVATFYSGRSRASGTVSFCVRDVTKADYTYVEAESLETCADILK